MNISIYISSGRVSPMYYRIYQYFDEFEYEKKYKVIYRKQLPEKLYTRYMPVSQQSLYIKLFLYVMALIRIFTSLLCDLVYKKDIIVISRRLISRYTPFLFIILLWMIKRRGSKIIWDFDDRIVGTEVSRYVFNVFSMLSDVIVVTHSYLKSLILEDLQNKVVLMPTTDGDLYKNFSEKLNAKRIKTLSNQIILVWVGTSVNLPNIIDVISFLDDAAYKIFKECSKKLILKVVCDKPLVCDTKNIVIDNIKWTRKDAIYEMYNSHIGIMPLRNVEYSKGKGGFKLVQYISIGLPCIASNVGFNSSVISNDFGFLINDNKDWCNAIIKLSDVSRWNEYSINAYNYWMENFSFESNYNRWCDIIESCSR